MTENIRRQLRADKAGFTLIEIIIGLLAFSILAVMLTTQLSSYVERSVEPMTNLTDTMTIYSVMEKISLDYDINMGLTLAGLQTKIGAEGTSQSTIYGDYYVINNDYYECDAGSSTTFSTGGTKTLLVTVGIQGNTGINVSNLFTE